MVLLNKKNRERKMRLYWLIGLWPSTCVSNRATSYKQMEKLSDIENFLIQRIEAELQKEETKLSLAKNHLGHLKEERVVKNKTGSNYLAHPVNQYKLIRRFTDDWKEISNSLNGASNSQQLINDITSISDKVIDTSSDEIAQDGILRLQTTYFIGSDEFQSGQIGYLDSIGSPISRTSPKLSARDCYDIGRRGYLNSAPTRIVRDWMETALRLVDPINDEELYIVILDHLAFTWSKMGNTNAALKYYLKLSELRPDDTRFKSNINHYRTQLRAKWRVTGDDGKDGIEFDPMSTSANDNPSVRDETKAYETICRLPNSYNPSDAEKLKCFYWHNDEPFLRIGPIKAEMLWHEPEFIRFYDIISPKEVEIIDRLSKPISHYSTVQDPTTGELVNAHYRISEAAWLTAKSASADDQAIRRFRRRISLITGLTMERAEDVQYSNYGIGGQYEPHFDHATENDVGQFDEIDGNRIATWLTYLTQPIAGGDTAFIVPGIKAEPIARSAVFWYNLLRDGRSDNRTRHAACPVLAGEKSVSNIWFHERGEEFTRKCLPEQTDKSTLKMFP